MEKTDKNDIFINLVLQHVPPQRGTNKNNYNRAHAHLGTAHVVWLRRL